LSSIESHKQPSISPDLIQVIGTLSAMGLNQKAIGSIIGYKGSNFKSWFAGIRHKFPDLQDAIEEAGKQADAALIASMAKAAFGYPTTQIKRKYRFEPNPTNRSKPKRVLVEEEEIIREVPPVPSLAMFMAMNHMPEFYKNKIELEKRTLSVDLKGTLTSEEIKEFAGKLGDYANYTKTIESRVIEPESEDI